MQFYRASRLPRWRMEHCIRTAATSAANKSLLIDPLAVETDSSIPAVNEAESIDPLAVETDSSTPAVNTERILGPENWYTKLQDKAKLKSQDGKIPLLSIPQNTLRDAITARGFPQYRARQIFHAYYRVGETNFEEFRVGQELKNALSEDFGLPKMELTNTQISKDGTRKWLHRFGFDNSAVEVVYIPAMKSNTVCISSQVGCSLTCSFCHTGAQPKEKLRNLRTEEIIEQVVGAHQIVGDWPRKRFRYAKKARRIEEKRAKKEKEGPLVEDISNIVFMGMGEPLLNYRNVTQAINILNDPDAFNIGWKNITLSTSGVVPGILKLSEEALKVNLAVSLHASRDELRDQLVPLNKSHNLSALMGAVQKYAASTKQFFITFEYCVLKGVNDTERDAHDLARLVKNIPSHINLIPFNPWEGSKYETPTSDELERFAAQIALHKAGNLEVSVRVPRGKDIMGACGQLNTVANYK